MNKKSYLNCGIGALSLLLIGLALATPAEANVFTCRASALRVTLPLVKTYEPVVANPPDIPCLTDTKTAVTASVTLPLPPLVVVPLPSLIVSATVLSANTVAGKPTTAEGKAASASILGLVTATVLDATARVDSVGGSCKLSGNSSVTAAVVAGKPIAVGSNHIDVDIPLVGIVHFNHTKLESGTDFGKITQRALWLEITNLLLKSLGVTDVIVGEAIADFALGNPCS